ncbi:NAD-dependent dihydropyrimidine dehydrogenase subunit PreA [Desulfovibrio sp. OttesenSCG-928-G15]|nr:NAD-dependent dihydropyrimidine dehydrogenase subunit PreA [Desulfovibrio sp. OttesenSCG-928-G15]
MNIWLRNEAARCLLCHEAPCAAACVEGLAPDARLRSLRFDNPPLFAGTVFCADCAAPCEPACLHPDFPIRIKTALTQAAHLAEPAGREDAATARADISMDFCGVSCMNPFFLGSSVVASSYAMCANAFEAGWGGLVYKTISMLSLREVSPRFDAIGKEGTPFVGFRNLEQLSTQPLQNELDTLSRLKRDYPEHVVVASIMGRNEAEWTELAALVTAAGVDMVECNFSCPHMDDEALGMAVGCDPQAVAEFTKATKLGTHLPVLAKMTPNVTDMTVPALAAVRSGADGIAAINTIKSLTGILEESSLISGKTAVSGYSGKAVKPIAQRFVAEMRNNQALHGIPISGIGGIESWYDAAEYFALGCENVQIATAVMQYGYRIIDDLIDGLERFIAASGYASLREFVGSRFAAQVATGELDRNSITYPQIDREKCTGCGRCHIACRDGGHQAMRFAQRTPAIDGRRCVGCHLCSLVCPAKAIGKSKRVILPRES